VTHFDDGYSYAIEAYGVLFGPPDRHGWRWAKNVRLKMVKPDTWSVVSRGLTATGRTPRQAVYKLHSRMCAVLRDMHEASDGRTSARL